MYKPELPKILAAVAQLKLTSAESALVFVLLSRPPATEELYHYESGKRPDAVYRVDQLTEFYGTDYDWRTSERRKPLTWLSRPAVYKAAKSLVARGIAGQQHMGTLYLCLEKIVPAAKSTPVAKRAGGPKLSLVKVKAPRKR